VREQAVAVLVEVGTASAAHQFELVVAAVGQHDVAQRAPVGVVLLVSAGETQAQAHGLAALGEAGEEGLGPERRLFAEDRLRLARGRGLAGMEALLRVDAQEAQLGALARALDVERVAVDDALQLGPLADLEFGRAEREAQQDRREGEHADR